MRSLLSSNISYVIWDEVSCRVQGRQARFAAIDFETTGLDPKSSRIWQIGLVAFDGPKVVQKIDQLVNPDIPVSEFEYAPNPPDENELRASPSFADFASVMAEATKDRVVVGHRLVFDTEFWRHECLRADIEPPSRAGMCTKVLAFAAGKRGTLFDIAKRFGISTNGLEAHAGYADALVSARLAVRLVYELDGPARAKAMHSEIVASELHLVNHNSTQAQDEVYLRAHGF